MTDQGESLSPVPTFLETSLPSAKLSRIVAADRRAPDPLYGAHRWFARRPRALMRGVLVAASLPGDAAEDIFWTSFSDNTAAQLTGRVVYDPFHGGGSSLVEAVRLGATVAGREIDPVASRLVRHQLCPPARIDVEAASTRLIDHLHEEVGHLYPHVEDRHPLHYFSYAEVTCPHCSTKNLLYRNLIVARGARRHGSVSRPAQIIAFCPDCKRPKSLPLNSDTLVCCGQRRALSDGTWRGQRWTCPACASRFSHEVLMSGRLPRRVVAVEETSPEGRRFRPFEDVDQAAIDKADKFVEDNKSKLVLPEGEIERDERDIRPENYGLVAFRDMFTSRQLAVLGTAFAWIKASDEHKDVKAALNLAVSNALATNNKMCGYATDYGRLAALFSVRGYSLPALAVELNPLHLTGGRGTIPRTLARVAASTAARVRRYIWNTKRQYPEAVEHSHRVDRTATIVLGSAINAHRSDLGENAKHGADIVLTDPPYFDYISYDRLSAFYRAWTPIEAVDGVPIHPSYHDPVRSFGVALGNAFQKASELLNDGPLVFTYHSANPYAWEAVGIALDRADLAVTAVWPVLADPKMGHHGTEGACEFDLVIVTRRRHVVKPSAMPSRVGVEDWLATLGLTKVGAADVRSIELALSTAEPRWATL